MIDLTDPAFRSLVERFVERLREYRERLEAIERDAVASEESLAELGAIAHKLAGTAGTFGFPGVGARALDLEETLARDPVQVPRMVRLTIEAIVAADRSG